MDFQIGSRGHGGFVRFYPCGHGAVNMCLSVEGCELWQEIFLNMCQVDVCILILGMLCIMGGRWVLIQ